MLDYVVRFLAVATAAYVVGLVVSPAMPSYVPKLHPSFMAIGTCLFFTQGMTAYTANFGDNFRRRAPRRSLHGTIQMFGMMFVLVGAVSVISIKGAVVHSDFTVHVVLGYLTLALCLFQSVIGIFKFRSKERDGLVVFKWHAQLGPLVYFMLLLNIVLGCSAAMWSTDKGLVIILILGMLALAISAIASLLFGPRNSNRYTSSASSHKPSLSMPLNNDSPASMSGR